MFSLVPQKRKETVAEAIVAYADRQEAHFICMGTIELSTIAKPEVRNSVTLQVIRDSSCTVIISHFRRGGADSIIREKKAAVKKSILKRVKTEKMDAAETTVFHMPEDED